jgi:hypothetical protein
MHRKIDRFSPGLLLYAFGDFFSEADIRPFFKCSPNTLWWAVGVMQRYILMGKIVQSI